MIDSKWIAMVQQKIDLYGWMVQAVGDDRGRFPQFHYTVGLYPKVGFEVIGVGMPIQEGARILNPLATRIVDGLKITDGCDVPGLLADDYRAAMIRVRDSSQQLKMANRFYRISGGAPIDAWQLVFPDVENRLPWEDGCALKHQVLLGTPPSAS